MEIRTKILHGSILTGGDNETLLAAVKEMAQRILCPEHHRGQDYGSCRCCRKIFADIHPDVSYIRRGFQSDGKTLRSVIVVDQIRAVILDSVVLPNEASGKVYIFPEADFLNVNAQNALLKLLEEPPEGVYFLLCSQNPDILLPTVRSRCGLYYLSGEKETADEEQAALTELAGSFFHALGDELALLSWEAKAEKLDGAAMHLLLPVLGEESVHYLQGKELLSFQKQLKECREMQRVNVSSRHLAALLATFRNEE